MKNHFEITKETLTRLPLDSEQPSIPIHLPKIYKSMSQSTQTIRIPTHLALPMRSTTALHLRTTLDRIHYQEQKKRDRKAKEIKLTFSNLTRRINNRQVSTKYAHRRTRIITKKLRSIHQQIYSLQQT